MAGRKSDGKDLEETDVVGFGQITPRYEGSGIKIIKKMGQQGEASAACQWTLNV